jgi:hypothetical protein
LLDSRLQSELHLRDHSRVHRRNTEDLRQLSPFTRSRTFSVLPAFFAPDPGTNIHSFIWPMLPGQNR